MAFGGMIVADGYSQFFKVLIAATLTLTALLSVRSLDDEQVPSGEYHALLLLASTGMMVAVSAQDLLTLYLSLELMTLCSYILVGIRVGNPTSNEAAIKYFLLASFSSALLIYGIALTYGTTGTTKITGIATALSGRVEPSALVLFAAALLAIGFAFKIAAVPFHMWTPDVYQGAPTAVTAFMSAATKVAAFAALIRVLDVSFQPLTWNWQPVVWTLAALTMAAGSLIAIAQTDVKRMLAYSSIAHAGFILVGVSAPNSDGIEAALFYLVAYSAMILGAFGVVMLVSVRGEQHTSLESYRGLGRRSPVLGALMTLFLLSLAGIPPTAGFFAKVFVFGAAVRAGAWPLVLIAVLASVVAAFFYIRVIVFMYMQEPEAREAPSLAPVPAVTLGALAALTLLLGLLPGVVFGYLHAASVIAW